MASQSKNVFVSTYLDNLCDQECLFDLRAEYTILAVRLGRLANERNRSFTISISSDTPSHFRGHPEKFRELVFTLVENFLLNDGAEIIDVQINSKPAGNDNLHQLKITTVATGRDRSGQLATLLERPTQHPQVRPYLRHQHAMYRINKLLRAMKGVLQTEKLDKGIQYVAHLPLTKSNSDTISLWC